MASSEVSHAPLKRDDSIVPELPVSSRPRQHSNASSLSGIFQSRKLRARHKFTNDIRDYELLSDIGGVDDISYLYLARHTPSGQYVALKYTDLALSGDFELIDELIRTVRNANLCSHRNILPYLTTFVENERMWNVTYPMRAGSCRNIMKHHFPDGFSEVVVCTILREVLKAMVYMHENKMIHNDIRADNILLDDRGEVRITGLRQMVWLARGGKYVQSVFSLVGDNIEWAAPEVMAQNSNYDEKADIYSFGITALELAFNKTPFDDWPPLKVLLSKLEYECPAIISKKAMSNEFFRMVGICIQKDPALRPSAKELADLSIFKNARSRRYLVTHIVHPILGEYKHDPTATISTTTPYGTDFETPGPSVIATTGSYNALSEGRTTAHSNPALAVH
ncbi:hypothetical protein HDU85_001295 [Gaertneriomyces sp. JEL0708]|nr:hypothetical protein HDU85_001295 [Gaertneriomyces sp. JEL0708]